MATEAVTSDRNRFVVSCVIALGVLLVLFVVVMVSGNPVWAFYLFGVTEKFEILKFLGIGMGGVLVTLQVWMSHKRAKAMEAAANAQAKATEEQAKANLTTEQGQRQERLKNAIEHLGHQSDSVRLGGAYELFHLARDTEEFRRTVLDILCGHIRRVTCEGEYRKTHKSKPSVEIQSLLTLLFVQNHEVFKGLRANLQESWLNGSNLPGARLEKGDLTGAHLKRADLRKARLQGAHLNETRLHGAYLTEAVLQEAGLLNAHLQRATLEAAKLQCASLAGARLRGADLSWAHMHGAFLFNMAAGGAELQGAIFRQTQLHEADLRQVQLHGIRSAVVPGDTFAQRMRRSIDQMSNFTHAIFSGGLHSDQDVDSCVKGLSDEAAQMLREGLNNHIGQHKSHKPPEDSGVVIGAYSEEDAEKWIAEYEEAMSDIPKPDNGD